MREWVLLEFGHVLSNLNSELCHVTCDVARVFESLKRKHAIEKV